MVCSLMVEEKRAWLCEKWVGLSMTQRGVNMAVVPQRIKAPPPTHTPTGLITAISDPCRGSKCILHHCGRSETWPTTQADAAAALWLDLPHELVSTLYNQVFFEAFEALS